MSTMSTAARPEHAAVAPLFWQPIRLLGGIGVCIYYRLAYRITGWGHLPFKRGPTLLLINHQHDIESSVIVATMTITSWSWRYPIFTVSSRRMWEPDFMAQRIPWVRPFVRGINFGSVFSAMGMQPIENELHSKPLLSLAYWLRQRYGDLELQSAFRQQVLERLPSDVRSVDDVLKPVNSKAANEVVSLSDLLEPYRSDALRATRDQLEADSLHFERLVREGATLFLAPEGFYTKDGKMQRLRGLLPRLLPLAKVWLGGISYDPFVGQRLSLLYRVLPAVDGVPLDVQLKRIRPVTVSALLGTWLQGRTRAFTQAEALNAILDQLRVLPAKLFVEPVLRRHPEQRVRSALAGLTRLGTLRCLNQTFELTEQRTHPHFPRTTDIIEYQANFHAETLQGAHWYPEEAAVHAAS